MYEGKHCAAITILAAGLAGCSAAPPSAQPPPARMQRIGNNVVPSVVLTPVGARRIGVGTTPVEASGAMTWIPYSALLYEPDGSVAVYVLTAPLTYTRRLISVATIAGDRVYVGGGLTAGTRVVTVGAEELLGVQNGVGAET